MCSKHSGRSATGKKRSVIKRKDPKKRNKRPSAPQEESIFESSIDGELMEEVRGLQVMCGGRKSRRARHVETFNDMSSPIVSTCEKIFTRLKETHDVFKKKVGSRFEVWTANLVHAAPHTRRGTTHVDTAYHKKCIMYTVWVPISDVTLDNGCVTMFLNTCGVPIDYKHPPSDEGRATRTLTGKCGTVFVFDSRYHHRSESNITDEVRSVLIFNLKLKGINMVEL